MLLRVLVTKVRSCWCLKLLCVEVCMSFCCREIGLVVQGVEAGGRIFRDGRLRVKDQIIEINGTSLIGVDFLK